jgi:2'-5' RNA ligase
MRMGDPGKSISRPCYNEVVGLHVEAASLWLMPDGEVGERLGAWIDRLADRFRTERFPPHVTLLSGLSGDEADLAGRTRVAAATLAPVPVHLDTVDGREEHFRCLFVRAAEPAPIAAAHARLAGAFGRAADPAFLPHLSLVYGRLPEEKKRDLVHEAGSDLDERFEAHTLHLWTTAGPVLSWRELAVFRIGG